MRLRGLTRRQKMILNFLYKFRNLSITDPTLSVCHSRVKRTLGLSSSQFSKAINTLIDKGLVLPFRVDGRQFYGITLWGVREVEKHECKAFEGELSTSKVGIKVSKSKST